MTSASSCVVRTLPSYPYDLADLDGTLFFAADDGVHGSELWKSDGTETGTVLVKDIDPRRRGGPGGLTAVGDTLFFTADGDGVHGHELWTSDGTEAGTVMVKDMGRRRGTDQPSDLTAVGDTLFFTAGDGVHGRELWTSDGTEAGTVMVRDIGSRPTWTSPKYLTAVGATLFFTDDGDGVHGYELWTSDGTEAGTVVVKDIPQPEEYIGPQSLTAAGDRLFFTVDDGVHGYELWTSDGTEAGTVLVKDISPGHRSSGVTGLVGLGDTLFFTADDGIHGVELWVSDGTPAGTVMTKDINPTATGEGPSRLTAAGQVLFFYAVDGVHGRELWKSDGTEDGTDLVSDINPEAGSAVDHYYGHTAPAAVGARLFFAANDGTHGEELWTSDGTTGGTVLVKDITPGSHSSYMGKRYPGGLTAVGERLFFSADDGIHGDELWSSDGTEAGTPLVEDINPKGVFKYSYPGTADTTDGTIRLEVSLSGAGSLVVRSAGEHLVKPVTRELDGPGSVHVTLTPTAKGMRELRRSLQQAHQDGDNLGTLRVQVELRFVPSCGATPNSLVQRFTLKLR